MQVIGNCERPGDTSLYIHVPFCHQKCPYCHFYVLPDHEPSKADLLKALELHWKKICEKLDQKRLVSIYFGGGTPSLFGTKPLETTLEWIRKSCHLSPDCEITLEVNPENVSLELMQGFKEIGINRISLGVQALENTSLKRLKRTHGAKEAICAVESTARAGISNISIDLMYELPGQTLQDWEETLFQAISLPISHLSLYNLTFEPQTIFYKRKKELLPLLPSPETSLKMLEMATQILKENGLQRYEISAFAKKGLYSKHNTGYWLGRPFLGLGPSAFSYFDKRRFRNIAHLQNYYKALQKDLSPWDFEEELSLHAQLKELLAIHLRLLEGVNLQSFEQKHGFLPQETKETLFTLKEKGWLFQEETLWKLSELGLLFYDSVAEEIV